MNKDVTHLPDYGHCTQIAIFVVREGSTLDVPHERYCPIEKSSEKRSEGEEEKAKEYVLWGGAEIVLPCRVERRSIREIAIAECGYYCRMLVREGRLDGEEDEWVSLDELVQFGKVAECCGNSKETLVEMLSACPEEFLVGAERQRVKQVLHSVEEDEDEVAYEDIEVTTTITTQEEGESGWGGA